jgi:hypothetical protein
VNSSVIDFSELARRNQVQRTSKELYFSCGSSTGSS